MSQNPYEPPRYDPGPHGLGAWTIQTDDNLIGRNSIPPAVGPSAGYLIGGYTTDNIGGGMTQNVYHAETYELSVDPAAQTLGAMTTGPSLNVARSRVGALVHAGVLYAIGGYDPNYKATVEYAPIMMDGTLGAFVQLDDLPNPSGGTLGVYTPTMCADDTHLYVIGGQLGSSKSDIVLVAPIEADGALGPFSATTKLDGPLLNSTCFIQQGRLFLIGGEGATTRTDRVASIEIMPDGTLGASWTDEVDAKLPFARSHCAIATYIFP